MMNIAIDIMMRADDCGYKYCDENCLIAIVIL